MKKGNVVYGTIQFSTTQSFSNGDILISGIPSGYRPVSTCITPIVASGGSLGIIQITTDGEVKAGGTGIPIGTWWSVSYCAIAG